MYIKNILRHGFGVICFLICVSSGYSQVATQLVSLQQLDDELLSKEQKVEGIKAGNAAKVIWSKQYKYQKSPIVFVYLHGFGASHREGEPIMSKLSEKYNANVFMARLEEHGIDRENGFEFLTPENYMASAKEALKIGKSLGDKIILVSTSTGGTLSLSLAAVDNEIAGLILYSPFVGLINPLMGNLAEPGGKEFFIQNVGGEIQKQKREPEEAKYWSTSYHVNGYVSLISMVKNTMKPETFSKVECPVFLAYYYKNEVEQDKVVSVPAMLKMYDELGTSAAQKFKKAFPDTGNHVIGCDLRSKDWKGVYNETVNFINTILIK